MTLLHKHLLPTLLLTCHAAFAADSALDLNELSLEELLKTEVITVARKAQTVQTSAAAVFVISREDIERSGATHLPEALRLAPGVQVARLANNRWAISARGFNGRFSNKLLVLLDGRSIYSPLFSGVIWEGEDTLLEDIERIEVIRGPGASMWGANAVNGVINIITRKARDTQGNLLSIGAGTNEGVFSAARHGGPLENGHFRLWAKAFSHEGSDYWRGTRAGFRSDWSLGNGQQFMLSGSMQQGKSGESWNTPDIKTITSPASITQTNEGAHLLGRYEWLLNDGAEARLQTYLDTADINVRSQIHEQRNTADIDFQYHTAQGKTHAILLGGGYRHSQDKIDSANLLNVIPARRSLSLINAFIHDEITLVPETLQLMLGSRFEQNSVTGFSPQPNARLMWTPNPSQTLWGAIARAVRTPSRTERDAQTDMGIIPANTPPSNAPFNTLLRYSPTEDRTLKAEKVTSTELGYRQQWNTQLSMDLAAFRSEYSDLRSAQLMGFDIPSATTPAIQHISPNNALKVESYGFEAVFDYRPSTWWRIQPSYSYLRMQINDALPDGISQNYANFLTGNTPRHQASIRSSLLMGGQTQLDFWLRHVGKLAVANVDQSSVPAYTTLDIRYAWRVKPGIELSLTGQNLLQPRHTEFVPDQLPAETLPVERGAYLKLKAHY